jgi:hypothetical protein
MFRMISDKYLPFDFSGIKPLIPENVLNEAEQALNKGCSASFKTFFGKTLSFKLILRNVCLYKQPNVTMTPEHIMQTRSTQ